MGRSKIILAGDPGKNNYAITVLKITDKETEPLILYSGYLHNPISNLLNKQKVEKTKKKKTILEPFHEQVAITHKEITNLIAKYNPNLIVMERFQGRGLKGSLSEVLAMTMMVFFVEAHIKNIEMRLVTAAQWKNELKKQVTYRSLDSIYDEAKTFKIKAHQIDSTLIGIFSSGIENCFSWLKFNDKYQQLLKNLKNYE